MISTSEIQTPNLEGIERVFILRPDNLGDVVLFSGALQHIRTRFPAAEITICVKDSVRGLLDLCPHVDRILTIEELAFPLIHRLIPINGRILFGTLRRLLPPKVRVSSDLVLLPVRSPTPFMHKVVKRIHAQQKCGISGDLNNQPKRWDNYSEKYYTGRLSLPEDSRWSPELDVTRDFLRFLGIEVDRQAVWPQVWTDEADREIAAGLQWSGGDEVLVGICPGVNHPKGKSYSRSKLAAALGLLNGRAFRCVLLGSPGETRANASLENHLRRCANVQSIINLTGQTTIRQLVHVLERCEAIISSDSAPLHLSVALGKPTVGIMGGGHCDRFYPWGNSEINRVARRPMSCYGCNWHCQYLTMRCVQEILPSDVAKEIACILPAP